MPCEICGKENVSVYPTVMEGSTLRVCENCGGKRPLATQSPFSPTPAHSNSFAPKLNKPHYASLDEGLDIVPDLGKRVAEKREKMHLTRPELAAMLMIKESVLQKIEHDSHKPDDALLKALEQKLQIKLRNKKEEEKPVIETRPGRVLVNDQSHLTLEDILNQQLAQKKNQQKKELKK